MWNFSAFKIVLLALSSYLIWTGKAVSWTYVIPLLTYQKVNEVFNEVHPLCVDDTGGDAFLAEFLVVEQVFVDVIFQDGQVLVLTNARQDRLSRQVTHPRHPWIEGMT